MKSSGKMFWTHVSFIFPSCFFSLSLSLFPPFSRGILWPEKVGESSTYTVVLLLWDWEHCVESAKKNRQTFIPRLAARKVGKNKAGKRETPTVYPDLGFPFLWFDSVFPFLPETLAAITRLDFSLSGADKVGKRLLRQKRRKLRNVFSRKKYLGRWESCGGLILSPFFPTGGLTLEEFLDGFQKFLPPPLSKAACGERDGQDSLGGPHKVRFPSRK